MNKKGKTNPWLIIGIIAVLLVAGGYINLDSFTAGGTDVPDDEDDKEDRIDDLITCDGLASVSVRWDDKDYYKTGTDPASALTMYSPIYLTGADDSATVSPALTQFKALAGNNAGTPSTTYFSKETAFETVCSDIFVQEKLYKAGAPTLTWVNDDGITVNADATNHESMAASSSYTPELTVKSAAETCASVYGAYAVAEYDASYVASVEPVHGLTDANTGIYIAHTTNHSGIEKDFDQYKVMKYSGMLCDGAKDVVSIKVTTIAADPGEDQANVLMHWLPINKDIDADEYTLITGIYDEDNNAIFIGNTTKTYHTA